MGQKSRFKRSLGPLWEESISRSLTRKSTVAVISSADTLEIRGLQPDPPDISQNHRCFLHWNGLLQGLSRTGLRQHEGLQILVLQIAGTHPPRLHLKDGPHMHGTCRAVWVLGLNKAQPQHTLGMARIKSTSTLIYCPLIHAECPCSTFA